MKDIGLVGRVGDRLSGLHRLGQWLMGNLNVTGGVTGSKIPRSCDYILAFIFLFL